MALFRRSLTKNPDVASATFGLSKTPGALTVAFTKDETEIKIALSKNAATKLVPVKGP